MGTRETLRPKLSGMLTSCTQCQGKHSNTFAHAISERWRDKQNGTVIWGRGNNIRHALRRNGQRNKKNKNNNYNDKKKKKTETIQASIYCPNYLKNNIEPHGNLIDSYTCYRLRVCSTRYSLAYWKQDITESKILHLHTEHVFTKILVKYPRSVGSVIALEAKFNLKYIDILLQLRTIQKNKGKKVTSLSNWMTDCDC